MAAPPPEPTGLGRVFGGVVTVAAVAVGVVGQAVEVVRRDGFVVPLVAVVAVGERVGRYRARRVAK